MRVWGAWWPVLGVSEGTGAALAGGCVGLLGDEDGGAGFVGGGQGGDGAQVAGVFAWADGAGRANGAGGQGVPGARVTVDGLCGGGGEHRGAHGGGQGVAAGLAEDEAAGFPGWAEWDAVAVCCLADCFGCAVEEFGEVGGAEVCVGSEGVDFGECPGAFLSRRVCLTGRGHCALSH